MKFIENMFNNKDLEDYIWDQLKIYGPSIKRSDYEVDVFVDSLGSLKITIEGLPNRVWKYTVYLDSAGGIKHEEYSCKSTLSTQSEISEVRRGALSAEILAHTDWTTIYQYEIGEGYNDKNY